MKRLFFPLFLALAALLAGCATPPANPYTQREQVLHAWGPPAQRQAEADGGERLFYPTAPQGFITRVVSVAPDGLVRSVSNVLVEEEFAKVRAGDTEENIRQRFGPPGWVQYFAQRDERVWEWRFCDAWMHPSRFNVLFDGKTRLVRSTMMLREDYGQWRNYCTR